MKIELFAAAMALSLLATTSVIAAEGNGDPFPFRAPTAAVSAGSAYAADTGSAAYPASTGRPASVVVAGQPTLLPANGSEGSLETANALPLGAAEGTLAYVQGLSVKRYLAQRETVSAQTAWATQPSRNALGG